jgi:PleD family two-component response regulator
VGQVTASFGIASCREVDTAASLLARADAALYRAKAAGRHRVEPEHD